MPRKIDTAYVEYLPDFTRFAREADRQIAGALRDVERTAEASAEDVEDSFNELRREVNDAFDDMSRNGTIELRELGIAADQVADEVADDFQRAGEQAEDAFSELRRSANRQLDRIGRDAAQTTAGVRRRFSALAIAGGVALVGLAAAGTAGLGALATMGLSSAAALEQVQISFNSLLGGAEEGQRVFRELQQFAAITPFEFPEVAAAAKRFLAFNDAIGMTDAQLMDFLTVVGDIASVTGAGAEGMNRLAFAIGQIASRGRVQLEEVNQISEAIPGFSALAAIANHFGVTTAEAMDMISKGAVDATEGVSAIIEGMKAFPGAAGAMAMQAETLMGVFSTFKDVVSQSLADSFAPVIPDIKESIKEITPIFQETLETFAPVLGDLVSRLLTLVGPLVAALEPIVTPLVQGLSELISQIAPALEPLGGAIGAIVAAIVPLVGPIGEFIEELVTAGLVPALMALVPVIEELVPPLGDVLIALIPLIPPLGELLASVVQLLVPIADLVGWLLELYAQNADTKSLAVGIQFLADAIGAFAGWLDNIDWKKTWESIVGGLKTAWDAVVGFFSGVQRAFRELPGRIMRFIRSIPQMVANLFGRLFDATMQTIGIGIGLIITSVTKLPGMIMDAIRALPGMIASFFTGMWNTTSRNTTSMLDRIVGFIAALPVRIVSALRSLPGRLLSFLRNVFTSGREIVRNIVDDIVDFFRRLPSRLSGFARNVATGITNFVKSFLNRAIDGINSGIATVDSFVPGSLPRLPRLARGGIAFSSAIIGEDPGTSPEAALPLGDSRAMGLLVDAFTRAINNAPSDTLPGMANNFTVVVEIDGQQLEGRIVSVVNSRDRETKNRVTRRRPR